MLNVGEKLWNGAIVTEQLAYAYNSRLETVKRFESEGREAPEYLINGLHKLIAEAV